MTVLTLCVVWFAHLHIIHVHERTIGKSMIKNDIILFDHCDDNGNTSLCVIWFAHICIIHDDEMTLGRCMVENDIILFNHCDDNDSTDPLSCFGLPTYIFSMMIK